ncbi:flagellar basal body L-ring protein FlgH [Microbulbifer sp. SSSA008]|uniref:flagellar basal body L-ring protein FlgH n=1 Tax=Microbulbifer sp. SSSA008 TaxID=3243380 RepID=UPI0040395D3D
MKKAVKVLLSIMFINVLMIDRAYSESLFSDETFIPLIADYRAVAIGDTVTIVIVETSLARANDGGSGSAAISVGAAGHLSTTTREEIGGGSLDLSVGGSSDSSTNRDGLFKAVITADVAEISPSGNLFLHGKQHLLVNGEDQYISVTGWVSPYHVDDNNTVLSSRLSQAKIVYSGKDPDRISIWNKIASFICCPGDGNIDDDVYRIEEIEADTNIEDEVFGK